MNSDECESSAWQETALGELWEVNPERRLKRGQLAPKVTMATVSPWTRSLAHDLPAVAYSGGSRFINGDSLLARITPCLENGKGLFINALRSRETGHGSTEFIVLAAKQGLADPLFGYYLTRDPRFREYAIRQMTGTSGRQRLSAEAVAKYATRVPPADEQRAISDVLGALDDKIESNRRLSHHSSAFFGLVAEERLRQARDLGADEMALGEIAMNIKVKSEEITRPYIGLDLMPQGSTVLTAWLAEDGPSTSMDFEAGDILFGKLRPYFKKVGVAPIAGRCSSEILVVRPQNPDDYGQVVAAMSSQNFIDHCNAVSTGTKMPRSEWKLANLFHTPRLTRETSLELTSLARSSYQLITRLTVESVTLKAIRDTLLPRLISGKLRVQGFGEQEKAA
jgi:type I restriction enzyme S subunit